MTTTEQSGTPVFSPESQELGERLVADILTTGSFDPTDIHNRENSAQIYGYIVGQLSIIIDKFLEVYPEPQREQIRDQMVLNFQEGHHGLQREPAAISEDPEPAPQTEPEPVPQTTPEPMPGTTPEPTPGTTPEPAPVVVPEPQAEDVHHDEEFGEGRANQPRRDPYSQDPYQVE